MNFISMSFARKFFRMSQHNKMAQSIICAANLLCFGLSAITASATTPAEEKIFKAPMPHELLDSKGAAVKVHWARLDGYLEGKPDNETRLSQLKQQVQTCIDDHRRSGHPSKPPGAWPDHVLGLREDTYASANRSIHYSNSVTYAVNFNDCSLLEQISSRADLVSSKGACRMDLIHKTASGVCDANAHADAIVLPHRAPPDAAEIKAVMQKMAADPRMAAMAAAMQKVQASSNTRTGQKKTILGLECDVWNQDAATEGGTMCFARGGSFMAARTGQNPADAGLLLEIQSQSGFKMKAVDAKLDTEVNARVFAPYLSGGFVIKTTRLRK